MKNALLLLGIAGVAYVVVKGTSAARENANDKPPVPTNPAVVNPANCEQVIAALPEPYKTVALTVMSSGAGKAELVTSLRKSGYVDAAECLEAYPPKV